MKSLLISCPCTQFRGTMVMSTGKFSYLKSLWDIIKCMYFPLTFDRILIKALGSSLEFQVQGYPNNSIDWMQYQEGFTFSSFTLFSQILQISYAIYVFLFYLLDSRPVYIVKTSIKTQYIAKMQSFTLCTLFHLHTNKHVYKCRKQNK